MILLLTHTQPAQLFFFFCTNRCRNDTQRPEKQSVAECPSLLLNPRNLRISHRTQITFYNELFIVFLAPDVAQISPLCTFVQVIMSRFNREGHQSVQCRWPVVPSPREQPSLDELHPVSGLHQRQAQGKTQCSASTGHKSLDQRWGNLH